MGKTIRRSKKNTRSRKTRTFKKHYMWNTKGKKYLAKTYKQHLKGKKLGHTHTKPKKKSRKTRKGGEGTNLGDKGIFRDDGWGRGLSGEVWGKQFTQNKEVNYNGKTYPPAEECAIYGKDQTVEDSILPFSKRTKRRKDAWGKWGLTTQDGKLALNSKGHPYLLDEVCNPVMNKDNKDVHVVLDSDAKVLVGTSGNIFGRMYQRASNYDQIMKEKGTMRDLTKNTVGNVGKAFRKTASIGVDAAATGVRASAATANAAANTGTILPALLLR